MGVKTVTDYEEKPRGPRSKIVKRLRTLVRKAAPAARESVKWAQAVFEVNGPFCYIRAHSKHVNLGFFRGAEMRDPAGLLEGTGERMRHVKILSLDAIDDKGISKLIKEAVVLNCRKGNPISGK